MKPLTIADIKGPAVYAGIRDDFRKRIIELKHARRVFIGPMVELVFENRQTLIFQTEEMLRAEGIYAADKIQEEVDVYAALMPTDSSLSATLFLAVPRDRDSRAELDRLIGLDEHVILHIGDHAIRAAFEPGRSTDQRISAVQYTTYPLSPGAKQALLRPATVITMEIDHPEYQYKVTCSEELRASLAADYESC